MNESVKLISKIKDYMIGEQIRVIDSFQICRGYKVFYIIDTITVDVIEIDKEGYIRTSTNLSDAQITDMCERLLTKLYNYKPYEGFVCA